ncbi:nuclear pore complex protein DDB_G0274915 isoform X3 [Anopheles funestus]|uniref:nuclear pore complex protein DDB_G0274915 isoform X3 n=1 Tax=Anopheles funestus TaxID=62324 RepID=UPI0020C65667|nr:nuclear pore complex protein DDB_G0274915 isoform X3 [Anopheles funestus]
MDECQHELDFEELEKLCRTTPEDELSAEEEDTGTEQAGGEEGGGAERFRDMGQSESKKASKKAAATDTGLHTKGTAMSFGFKKHKVHQATSNNGTIGTTGTNKLATGAAPHTGDIGGGTEPVPGAVANQIKKFNNNNLTNNNNNNSSSNATLEREKAERELVHATVITNPGVDAGFSDKNGNTGSIESVEDTAGCTGRNTATGRTTPRLQPAKKDSHGAPYRSNRFGFRTNNIVRPASVGLQPRVANDFDKHSSNNINNNNNSIHTNNNNNNNVYVVSDKRRSKSASSAASARTTFTPLSGTTAATGTGGNAAIVLHQHAYGGGGGASALHRPLPKYQAPNTKITHNTTPATNNGCGGYGTYQQQQQMTKCNQEEHKNTQHSGSGSRQTTQQHQYTHGSEAGQNAPGSSGGLCAKPPLAGNGTAVPTTTAKLGQEGATIASKFTLHSSSLPKPQYPVSISLTGTTSGPSASSRYTMDTKGAKHAVNVSRKEFANTNVTGAPALEDTTTTTTSSIRMPRQRYRNMEMVMSGRHKFEVRDLEALTTEPIVPLPLPELPSAFCSTTNQRTAPLSGLIRSTELNASANASSLHDDIDINDNRYEMAEPGAEEEAETTPTSQDGEGPKESLEEEKLLRDNNSSEKSLKGALMKDLVESYEESKSSTPSCSRASWFTAGEALAAKDFGIRSLSTSVESSTTSKQMDSIPKKVPAQEEPDEEDISSVTITAGNPSAFSSISAPVPMDVSTNLDSVSEVQISFTDPGTDPLASSEADVPNRMYRNEQTKFAEMAAAISDVLLLDDETSPTDSLVSSCTENSDDAKKPRHAKKAVENTKEKEKDIDEISPELDELTSPVSPGTPTHASNSLSLSDGGRDFLIDDEIADQPGLVFDEGSTLDLGSLNLNLTSQKTDTPTLKDNHHNRTGGAPGGAAQPTAIKATPPSAAKPRKAMPDAYESPALSRKSTRSGNRMARAESLDTLSPCDSIASDDFMLDFDCNSSMDSIDRVARSSMGGSATGLNSMDELQLWSELENKGGHIIREWSTLLRSSPQSISNSTNRSQLPARARLLTRRLQNNATPTNGSESPRSIDSLPRRTFSGSYKTATLSQFHNLANNNCTTDSASTATNSAEDLTLLDKSLRNSMLQDVVHFKKQLVRLRRILQETDTLNPFENNNGQFFTTAAAAIATANGSIGSAATTITPSAATTVGGPGQQEQLQQQQQENVLIRESSVAALALLEDQRQELADLRRQVVYLQGELTAKDRTIRQQQNLIEKYEAEREKQLHSLSNGSSSVDSGDAPGTVVPSGDNTSASDRNQSAETISTATQTERLRPVSFGGQEGLGSRSEKPALNGPKNGLRTPTAVGLPSNTTSTIPSHHTTISNGPTTPSKSKTQISSVYTQLSSVRHSIAGTSAPTTPTQTTTHNGPAVPALRRTSVGSSHNLSSFGLHTASDRSPGGNSGGAANKPVRTTHIGTLPSPTARTLTNGDRMSAPNGATKPSKSIPNRTSASNGGVVTKLNGLNGTTKRTGIIRPPSSFGSSNSLVPMEQQLKSKSAPATPLVVANGKLLTPAATGGTDCSANGEHREESSSNERNNNRSESESDKGTTAVVNGAGGTLVGNLKLITTSGTVPTGGGCSDGSNLGNATTSTVNGIVGH